MKIKDYQLVQKQDQNGIYFEGKITNRKGEEFIIYVCDKGKQLLEKYNWCIQKVPNTSYLIRNKKINNKKTRICFHRVITNCTDNLEVDHINRNGLDNRLNNLRCVTKSENSKNRSRNSNNKSGYIGVSYHGLTKKWQVHLKIKGKIKYLGLFNCKKEAAIAYNKEAAKHGYLNLNEID